MDLWAQINQNRSIRRLLCFHSPKVIIGRFKIRIFWSRTINIDLAQELRFFQFFLITIRTASANTAYLVQSSTCWHTQNYMIQIHKCFDAELLVDAQATIWRCLYDTFDHWCQILKNGKDSFILPMNSFLIKNIQKKLNFLLYIAGMSSKRRIKVKFYCMNDGYNIVYYTINDDDDDDNNSPPRLAVFI